MYAQFPHLIAEDKQFTSGCLFANHADPDTCKRIRYFYLGLIKDHNDRSLCDDLFRDEILCNEATKGDNPNLVFLEKTPRNSLNIDFLLTVFPSSKFIFLHRDARENISSIIEGWELGAKTGRFVTFRDLPDWPLDHWCFLLPPGWQKYKNATLAELAAFQWQSCNEIIMAALLKLSTDRWTTITYAELINSPCHYAATIVHFLWS